MERSRPFRPKNNEYRTSFVLSMSREGMLMPAVRDLSVERSQSRARASKSEEGTKAHCFIQ